MGIMHSEYRDRINHWIRTLKEDFYTPVGTLNWEVFKTMEQLSYEEAGAGTYERVEPGYTWGGRLTNMRGFAPHFHCRKKPRERELYWTYVRAENPRCL